MILTIASANTSYYIGLGLGFLVVVVVVVLVALILTFSSRLADQAHGAADVMATVRDNTSVLAGLETTSEHANAILAVIQSARGGIER
jgi:hypothetical protein